MVSKNEEPAIVKIYNAKDIVTAQILKALLKEEKVEVFVQNSGSEVAGHSTPGFGIYGVDIYMLLKIMQRRQQRSSDNVMMV